MASDEDIAKDKPYKSSAAEKASADNAANLIRQKLDELYETEPDAKDEAKEAQTITSGRSKHQEFMYKLSNSGKPLAEIQTAWHEYYSGLSDKEKHEVWDEFYEQNQHISPSQNAPKPPQPPAPQIEPTQTNGPQVTHIGLPDEERHRRKHGKSHHHKSRSVAEVKHQLLHTARPSKKLAARQHVQSLVFGLGVGSFVVLVMLFGFFNERFIAPFISPSRHVSSTPIITDPSSTAAGPNSEIIIPKINVEVPVVYDVLSTAESSLQDGMNRGVIHYATTPYPGEKGNVVIFGHSSNNLFNPGKFKFAFVLLSKMSTGDLFYLTRNGTRYTYKIYEKRDVQPNEVSVLGPAAQPDSVTLITCDPPGTSWHRLVVTGEQISPDPTNNKISSGIKSDKLPATLPSNSPSLWSRIVGWFTH